MELMDVLRERRAVREYTRASVERPVIERLINAAILAPSAMNMQPWAFAALIGQERVDQLAERVKSWLLANFSDTMYGPAIRA